MVLADPKCNTMVYTTTEILWSYTVYIMAILTNPEGNTMAAIHHTPMNHTPAGAPFTCSTMCICDFKHLCKLFLQPRKQALLLCTASWFTPV
jgi:hypothetical protein